VSQFSTCSCGGKTVTDMICGKRREILSQWGQAFSEYEENKTWLNEGSNFTKI
jgi:hypothetical protein